MLKKIKNKVQHIVHNCKNNSKKIATRTKLNSQFIATNIITTNKCSVCNKIWEENKSI